MLPDRSKRYAGIDGEIPRLILATNWQLLLVALLVLVLLVLIFPRKTLVEKLYEQEALDELTLSYIQNLYRADSKNADAAILLTKAQQNTLDLSTLESRLLPLMDAGDVRQRTEAWVMLTRAYEKALASRPEERERKRLVLHVTEVLQKASQEQISEPLARLFAAAAFEVNLPSLGLGFLAQVEVEHAATTLEKYGRDALGKGNYGVAAEYFLMARDQTTDRDDARRLFQKGIGALMAASRYAQALQSAQLHLGNLADDPVTLRFLARTAQSAGDPVMAADYARRLVFQVPRPLRTP
jgi:hypothetical protein